MDNSCPATPLVLAETESKSPLRMATSPESDGMKSPSRDSPDPQCVICLGKLQNKSFTDSCLHQFCFQCLLQWSKVKPECPLCKQPFKSIINNVRSNLDYDQYPVEAGEPHCVLSDFMHSFNFDFIQVDRRFRYRSTMTREYFRELAESILAGNSLISNDFYQIPPMVPVDPAPSHNVRNSSRLTNSVRCQGTTDFRRSIYTRDLWVQDLADISGRYRECTPQFYRDNPAQIHRIVPWLNREVNVLLNDCESHTAYILTRIVSHLSQHPIRSREFRELVEPYFGPRTDHFIHELYTFAHSVYDITGFDQHAVYRPNPNYATEVQDINTSNDDSDVEIVETVKRREKKLRTNSKEGFKSILRKKYPRIASQIDEPVAGPSGVCSSASSKPLEISESDPEEIQILDYVKAEPEVVTLSSGEEVSPVFSNSDASKDVCVVVASDKDEKSSRGRASSDEDYVSLCEKVRNRCKSSKGKCKTNGFGLKGKQKQKYMKRTKRRSSSTDSMSSFRSNSSSLSKSPSSSSSSSSDRKSKKKKTKTRRKKSKKKIATKSSSNKSQKSKRRKSNNSSSGDTVDENQSKTRKRVKSCVIVPNSNSCDSFHASKISEDHELERDRSYPSSYWSFSVSNPIKEKSQKRRRKSSVRKGKRKNSDDSSEEKTVKRAKNHSSGVDSNSDEPLASRLKSCLKRNRSTKESRGSSSRSKKTKMDDSPTVNRDSQSENSPYTYVIGHCETLYAPDTSSTTVSHSEASRDSTATNMEPNFT